MTSLQTITDNLMDLRERRSALLMRNPERYSPSAAAWLQWGPEACWHDRLDVDYLAVPKPTNRRGADSGWACVPRSPGCESLWAAPRRACWSSPWWWRCSSSWGCSRGSTSSSSASYSTRLKAQLREGQRRGRMTWGWLKAAAVDSEKALNAAALTTHGSTLSLRVSRWRTRWKRKKPTMEFCQAREAPAAAPWGYFFCLKLSWVIPFLRNVYEQKKKKSTRLSLPPEVKLYFSSLAPSPFLVGKCSALQDVWGYIKKHWVKKSGQQISKCKLGQSKASWQNKSLTLRLMIKYLAQNWRSDTEQCCSQRLEAVGPAANTMRSFKSCESTLIWWENQNIFIPLFLFLWTTLVWILSYLFSRKIFFFFSMNKILNM